MATSQPITPCLWFDGDAEAAADLYVSLFPDSRIVEVARYGEASPGEPGTVMTVSFELNGRPFLALNGGPKYRFTEAVSFQIHCDTQEDVDRYWAALTEGGEPGPCGWLKDRFGLSWQVVPTMLPKLLADPDAARAQRAMTAMMQMGKLDIAELERAADG